MAWAFFSVLLLMLPCGLQAFRGKHFRPKFGHVGCRTDVHCPTDSCCQITLVNRQYLGKCVPRDPDSMLCTRPKQCFKEEQCGAGSCCRFTWSKGKGGGAAAAGQCDKLGQEGDECTVITYGLYPRLCPCAEGLICDVPPSSGTGQCRAPTTMAPTTTTMAPVTTTTEDINPCGCPNLQFFCCLGDSCETRPRAGEDCDQFSCPCVSPLVCDDPDEGQCVMPP